MDGKISIFGLIEAAAATTKTCWTISAAIADIADNPDDVDDSLRYFDEEVRGLCLVLDAVYASVGKIAKLPTWRESDSDKEVWTAVHVSLRGCSHYLQGLTAMLLDIQKSNDKSASLAMRAKRLRINQEDFDANRIRVHRYTKKLQLALTMINLHICTDIASRSESRMENVYYLMNRLQVTVEGQWSAVAGNEDEAREASQLKRAAQKALSRASVLSDTRVVSYEDSMRSPSALSQVGEPIEGGAVNNIELWIDQLLRAEDDARGASISLPNSGSSYSTELDSAQKIPVHTEHEEGFNPEEDYVVDLMLALSNAGKRHYKNMNPEQAAENLDRALQYAKGLSRARYLKQDLTEDRLILATIYLQKYELDKAEEQLCIMIRESVATADNQQLITDAHLKLARVYYLKKAYDEALHHAQKCLHARTKMHGKHSKPYYETIQLLVLIYSGNGSPLEAEVMLEKLPADEREETEMQLQASAPVGCLPNSPPLSPLPAPSEKRNKPKSLFGRKRTSTDKSARYPPPHLSLASDGIESSSIDSPPNMPRHPSTASQNVDPAELLAQNGFSGDFESSKALTWAIVEGHLHVVHYLLGGYAIPKSRKNKFGLHGADSQAAEIAIKHARVDGPPKSKAAPPLITAIDHGRVMIAKFLLHRGASTSLKDPVRGITPLRLASERGHCEIVKLLLSKGAWIESPSTAELACFSGRDRDGREYRSFGPMHGAAAHGHEDIVAALLSAGTAIDARDTHGSTALKHACQRGQAGVTQLLIQQGASVSAADDTGFTPLMAACFNGHEGIIRQLRSSDSLDVNQTNRVGQSALMIAAEHGFEGAAKLLLIAGATLEHRDSAGWTALISASDKGHLPMALFLLGAGANINAHSALGSTPLDRAEYRQDKKLARALKDNGAINGSRKVEQQTMTAFTGYTL